MKKLFCFLFILLVLSGCGNMNNTPTKKVEAFLNKYQTNDKDVMDDLNDVLLFDSDMTDSERNDYREFMKKHYQDMTYKIKDETIDGDTATVEVEITVRSYADKVNEANNYRLENASEFDTDNTFASYRLDKLKDVKDTETYTINFYLNKIDDEWVINPISSDDESKINGLYGVNDINDSVMDTTESDSTKQDSNVVTDNAQNADNNAS